MRSWPRPLAVLFSAFLTLPAVAARSPEPTEDTADKLERGMLCVKAYRQEEHYDRWEVDRFSWFERCAAQLDPEKALKLVRERFILDCVEKHEPFVREKKLNPKILRALCARGRPGLETLKSVTERIKKTGERYDPMEKRAAKDEIEKVDRLDSDIRGAIDSGDISNIFGERSLKDKTNILEIVNALEEKTKSPGAGTPEDKKLPFKPQQRLKTKEPPAAVVPVPETREERLALIESRIIAPGVSPEAVTAAQETIRAMLENADGQVLANLIRNRVHVYIIPEDKKLVDLPEFAHLKGTRTFDGRLWDDVRGVANVPTRHGVGTAVPEENLTATGEEDPRSYPPRFVMVHEYGHMVERYGLPRKSGGTASEKPGFFSRAGSAVGAFWKGLGSLRNPDLGTAWTGAKLAYGAEPQPLAIGRSQELYRTVTQKGSGLGWYADANQAENWAESTAAYFGVGFSSDNGTPTSPGLLMPGMAGLMYNTYGPPVDINR